MIHDRYFGTDFQVPSCVSIAYLVGISLLLGLPVSNMLIAFRLCDVIRKDQLVHDYILSVTVSFV